LQVFSTGTIKKGGLRGFSIVATTSGREKEPEIGLFSSMYQILILGDSSMEDQKGGNHITLPGNHPCLMMSCRQAAGTKKSDELFQ